MIKYGFNSSTYLGQIFIRYSFRAAFIRPRFGHIMLTKLFFEKGQNSALRKFSRLNTKTANYLSSDNYFSNPDQVLWKVNKLPRGRLPLLDNSTVEFRPKCENANAKKCDAFASHSHSKFAKPSHSHRIRIRFSAKPSHSSRIRISDNF